MLKLDEAEKFKRFLEESFGDGVNIRELRLSTEETEYIKRIYPKASLNKSIPKEAPDGKIWYKVSLQPPSKNLESQNTEDLATVQAENIKLKIELERLKRDMANSREK
ncbi:hypothetical protein F7731_21095 [Cytobacillus depressus]|uniref:Uncharacterized protein n=1 Tax=Cytobacillus depressus TaxID=1602942 RepID=A0A6L3UZU1_9BACI|nr:hypothetical protein [Cytobacillus depressus]KAB2329962.1 hypothetical protein F7731_21095 [Cytobacillus depressus]